MRNDISEEEESMIQELVRKGIITVEKSKVGDAVGHSLSTCIEIMKHLDQKERK